MIISEADLRPNFVFPSIVFRFIDTLPLAAFPWRRFFERIIFMDKFVVYGGNPLRGTIEVGGMKNSALGILFGTILTNDICIIENLPPVSDITNSLEILRECGAKIKMLSRTSAEIDTRCVQPCRAPYEMATKMRASYYVLGAELGRFGKTKSAYPGGCDFGVRPIDRHIKGFEALGADVEIVDGCVCAEAKEGVLRGTSIFMDDISVGATINIMLAAVRARGTTIIDNAAREPHVVDLANFLNACGANISGAGTDVIKIKGVSRLFGTTYAIIPDMIEAGTYMMAAAVNDGSRVEIKNVIPKHLESITAKLIEMGVEIKEDEDSLIVEKNGRLSKVNVKTLPYPGFPTDMQPQMCALQVTAQGTSMLIEGVWENRFRYTEELRKMGAQISVEGRAATIVGVDHLNAARVKATDLRAGVAMIIAALGAEGRSEIVDIYHIERGYEDIVEKLRAVGANISREMIKEDEASANKVI